jgi:uncharacterized protein
MLAEAAMVVKHGYGALLFDLRNHGESEGTITTMGLHEPLDVCGAVDYLKTRAEVNPQRIALLGESLGGAAVLRAAVVLPDVRAVIAQATFSSLEDNIAEGVPMMTGLPSFPFAPLVIAFAEAETKAKVSHVRPVDEIASISPRPVLLIHGAQDRFLLPDNSQRLYDAALEPKQLVFIDNASHVDIVENAPREYAAVVIPFLNKYVGEGETASGGKTRI